MGTGVALLAAAVLVAMASPLDPAYLREIESWKAARLARLTAEDGWLSVVGLFWLEEGDNSVGASPENTVALPEGKAPERVGAIVLSRGTLRFRAQPSAGVLADGRRAEDTALATDAGGQPTVLSLGSVRFYVIERSGRFGVRVKDGGSPARLAFRGLTYFPTDPSWRIPARFEPYDPPRTISVPNVLGQVDAEPSPGALVFVHAGATYRLHPVLERGETDYFVIFADRTNGVDTYGAGRFLYVAPPVDGRTVIDFNKAYNPPCVFTDYATCPLPPAGNRLPFRVEAGEKAYSH